MAQNIDHQAALFFLFINLVRHHAHQLFLLAVKQNGVDHPAMDDQRVKGPADKIRHAQLIGPLHMAGTVFCGDHNHRDILNPVVFVHDVQHFKSVHIGHHNIQQDKGDPDSLLQRFYRLPAVLRLDNIILVSQHICQNSAVQLGIVHNQNFMPRGLFFLVTQLSCTLLLTRKRPGGALSSHPACSKILIPVFFSKSARTCYFFIIPSFLAKGKISVLYFSQFFFAQAKSRGPPPEEFLFSRRFPFLLKPRRSVGSTLCDKFCRSALCPRCGPSACCGCS